jgi:hypothetical protein
LWELFMAESKGELVVLHDRRDRLEANRLVRKLKTAGYRVALKNSPLGNRRVSVDAPTVLLWSRHAGARNLRSVLNDETAVIAKLDSRAAPFGEATVTDLRGWRGQDRHHGWMTLLEAVGPAATAPAKNPIRTAAPASIVKPVTLKSTPAAKTAINEEAPKAKGGKGVLIGVLAAIAVAAIGWAVVIFVL